jgi:hypothetical protein
MLIKNIFAYASINKIGILIDWSDNKTMHVKKINNQVRFDICLFS